jgi:O-antigen ligase
LVGLALAGGGFDVSDRHIAGLGVWLVVILLLVLGAGSGARLGWPLYWGAGLLGVLALFSALSSLWSGSTELSVIEADRVLVYLAFFLAAFLIAQTDQRRQRFAEGLVIAITLIALLGLGSRLFPHILGGSDSLGTGPRLRYPLGYWNANGAAAGVAIAMLLWSSRRAAWAALRWASVAAIPAVGLCIYFTYSRGGLVSLVVATGTILFLSRDRLWMLATLGFGALGALPAVYAVQGYDSLANNVNNQTTVDQGPIVALILAGGICLTMILFAGLRWIEYRGGRRTGRVLELSRHPGVLKGVAAAIAVVAIGVIVAVGGRAWDQFSSPDLYFPNDPSAHFSQLSGAGRYDFWRVAVDAFEDDPVAGTGAGTYQFSWEEKRAIDLDLHDAHSLYLEAFAELGAIGGILTLGLVLTLLWVGFGAWRNAPYPRREAYAALFAAMLAFAVGAAFDWFWEIAAMGAIFFLAAGVLVSVRCAQLVQGQTDAGGGGRRYGIAVVGLAVAWIAAVALVGPLLVTREITASQNAAADGDIPSAVSHADTARSIEPWAASPYVQLGLLAEVQGDYPSAILHFSDAIERENHNWQWYYLRSEAEHQVGDEAAAQTDIERARELNPRLDCLRTGWTCRSG